jgi:hypothetical protein
VVPVNSALRRERARCWSSSKAQVSARDREPAARSDADRRSSRRSLRRRPSSGAQTCPR